MGRQMSAKKAELSCATSEFGFPEFE